MLRILVLIGLFFFAINSLQAQVRTCGTVELQKLNKTEEQIQLEQDRFESWLSTQVVKSKNTSALESLDEETIYQIPVVVHIIHRGEPEGSGTNIPDEQVFAQIEALNLDFRHLNADSTNTPFEFQDLMADIAFEFVLAKRNPNGFKTDGITRTNGGATEWTYSDNDELKALSYWSSEDYLNIWVGQLADGLLGWAEFPTSTILAGVNDYATDNPLTDGVVITTEAFGSETLYPDGNYLTDFNEGRTLTHELGHFFGLRHIWGDGDCSDDDYVDDTPLTYNSYSSCPNLGEGYLYSCNNELSMFMNYMDYVDDACMNLFTLGQKERMQIVVNNSPRRASLLTSEALIPPPPLEITAVRMTDPGEGTCTALLNPAILVRNDGSTTITEVEMSFSLDGSLVESKGFSLTLEEDDSIELYFSALALPDFGSYQLDIEIDSVNGGIDDNTDNNIVSQQVN